jgi:clan AA aspartic protease (TIGR02281 family)
MICPKCGFNQPDDIYCALCGVHVEKYVHRKRKRRLKVAVVAVSLGAMTLALGAYLLSPEKPSSLNDVDETTVNVVPPMSRRTESDAGTGRDRSSAASGQTSRRPPQKEASQPGPLPKEGNKTKAPSAGEQSGPALTAREWFDKGVGLDDDSETEIEFYQKALEVDPAFAPAFFRLGAIYYRQANYEMADKEFVGFLQHATDEDKDAYDIYIYYSIAGVERLLEGVKKETDGKEEEKETSGATEKEATQETSAEEEKETSGGTEKESTQETPGQEGETGTEEVMTVIRFAPTDGHITVPVVLNESLQANVLIDTGAGITVLSSEMAEELDLDYRTGHSVTLKTMAMDMQARVAILDSIQVGGLKKQGFPVAVADVRLGQQGKFDAILGMDFLSDYTIQIDNKKHTLTLTPRTR